jgi:hypothetical protein
VAVLVILLGPRLAQPSRVSARLWRRPMTTMTSPAALVPAAPAFTNTERLALAGFSPVTVA